MGMIFISSTKNDYAFADRLLHILTKKGLRLWTGEYDLPPSNDYKGVIVDTIERCAAFIVIVSDTAMKGAWLKNELNIAIENNKHIFPVAVENIRITPEFSFLLEGCEFTYLSEELDERDSAIDELASKIKEACQSKTA